MDSTVLFQRFGLALAIGFLVGVERGWKRRYDKEQSRAAGARTYALIALLGGAAALLGQEISAAAFASLCAAFALVWIAFKLWETWIDGDVSATGAVAGLLVFTLGALAVAGQEAIAAAVAVAVTVVLAFKDAVHEWLRRLRAEELRSALLILSATFIALPLLPEGALDPYGAFNPRELWLLTIIVAGAGFLGYVALRTLGPEAGLYLGSAAAALVSSTVATLDLARRVRAGEAAAGHAGAAAALAGVIMFARVCVVTAAVAAPALPAIAPALAAATLAALAVAAILFANARNTKATLGPVLLGSPLDLRAVAQLALVLSVVTIVGRLLFHFHAEGTMFVFGAIAGLVDVDAVVLAVGGPVNSGLDAHIAGAAILLAVSANSLLKLGMGMAAGGAAFARPYALAMAAALAAGAAAYWTVTA
jgi:uncharacterized membrane protein (DUF4010 family)